MSKVCRLFLASCYLELISYLSDPSDRDVRLRAESSPALEKDAFTPDFVEF
jgi:hypothetical protein